jgi:hypothetical protein
VTKDYRTGFVIKLVHMDIKRDIGINSNDIDAFYKAIGVLVKRSSSPGLQKSQIDSFLNF